MRTQSIDWRCLRVFMWDISIFCSKPKIDENADPNDSLMTMMKQMYEEGDDEMKRTIAKAWTESRDKNPGMM